MRCYALYKSKSGQRTFFYRTVSLWNSLDNSLKLCDSSRNFKRKLRAKLFAAFLLLVFSVTPFKIDQNKK